MPMFEAVVNSLQAIEDCGKPPKTISVEVMREPGNLTLDDGFTPGPVTGFAVSDTGIGFTTENLDSFYTADSSRKAARGGKGLGRFVWLKAFSYAEIESHYQQDEKMYERSFRFSIDAPNAPNDPPRESKKTAPITTVRLVGMKCACPLG
jgi:hypothetical protein